VNIVSVKNQPNRELGYRMKKAIIIRKTYNNCFNLTKNPAWKGRGRKEGIYNLQRKRGEGK
jgi:hypothetical protein